MSGKKYFEFEISRWFQEQLDNAQAAVAAPVDLDVVQQRMQAAIDRDLAADDERRAATAAAVAELRNEDRLREEEPEFEEPTAEITGQWQHDAEFIKDLIKSALPHERYAPGRIAAIEIRLDSAAADAIGGRYRAALITFQDAFHELTDLRVELELRHVEWLTVYREATGIVMSAENAIAGVVVIPLRDAEGRAVEGTAFDLEYWSHGDSAAVKRDLARIAEELREETPGPSVDRLRIIRDEIGPELARRWRTALAAAEYEVYASQVRGNIADDVMVTICETAGYIVDRWGYEHGDERGRIYGRLRHPNGNEIVIEVAAAPNHAPTGHVRVLSYDHTAGNEEVMAQRIREITETLRARNLPVSDPVRESGAPELELLDVAALIEPVEEQPVVQWKPSADPSSPRQVN